MKVLVEKEFGGDGQKASVMIDDNAALVVQVSYPMAKLMSPINDVIDAGVAKIEALIPGDWDKAVLDPIAAGLKAEILALLSK